MDVGCGGVGLGYGGLAEFPLRVALVSLRNRLGQCFSATTAVGFQAPSCPATLSPSADFEDMRCLLVCCALHWLLSLLEQMAGLGPLPSACRKAGKCDGSCEDRYGLWETSPFKALNSKKGWAASGSCLCSSIAPQWPWHPGLLVGRVAGGVPSSVPVRCFPDMARGGRM